MTEQFLKRILPFSLTSFCCSAGAICSNNFENRATAFNDLTASETLTADRPILNTNEFIRRTQ